MCQSLNHISGFQYVRVKQSWSLVQTVLVMPNTYTVPFSSALVFSCSCWNSGQEMFQEGFVSGQVYGLALLYGMISDAHTDRWGARAHIWSQAQTVPWSGTQEREMISDCSSPSAADLRSFYEIINTFDFLQSCLSSLEKKQSLSCECQCCNLKFTGSSSE